FFARRRLLTGGAARFDRRALRAVGLGEHVLALRELIGRGAARLLGAFDLADQRAALFLEQARGIGKARALGLGLFDARLQRLDLHGRAVLARAPRFAVRADGRELPRGNFRFAPERLRARAPFGTARPLLLDLAARGGKWRLDGRRRRQRLKRALRLVTPRDCLLATCAQSRLGLGERREARGVAARLAFGFGVPVPRGLRFLLQRAPARACLGVGRRSRGGHALGGRDRRLFALDLAADRLQLGLDIGETGLCGEGPRAPRPA